MNIEKIKNEIKLADCQTIKTLLKKKILNFKLENKLDILLIQKEQDYFKINKVCSLIKNLN